MRMKNTTNGQKRSRHLMAAMLPPVLLALLIIVAFSGVFGGQIRRMDDRTSSATMVVTGPAFVRSGMFLEYEIRARARRAMANATIEFDGEMWKGVTINTIVPAPEAERFHDGVMRLELGPLRPGQVAIVRISGQFNPEAAGTRSASIILRDNDTAMAAVTWRLWIWP
jgi:hypothetical protein